MHFRASSRNRRFASGVRLPHRPASSREAERDASFDSQLRFIVQRNHLLPRRCCSCMVDPAEQEAYEHRGPFCNLRLPGIETLLFSTFAVPVFPNQSFVPAFMKTPRQYSIDVLVRNASKDTTMRFVLAPEASRHKASILPLTARRLMPPTQSTSVTPWDMRSGTFTAFLMARG
jgi:hypothetical protein